MRIFFKQLYGVPPFERTKAQKTDPAVKPHLCPALLLFRPRLAVRRQVQHHFRFLPPPTGEQLGDGEVQRLGQGLQQTDVGAAQPPLPFADSLDRHVELFRKGFLGQLLLFACLGNQSAGFDHVHFIPSF